MADPEMQSGEVPTVSFTSMETGTREDYELLGKFEVEFATDTATRILALFRNLSGSFAGYKIDRLQHSLQTATRAYHDKAEEEMVVAALLHDIGDLLAPHNHSELAAALLKPYVSEKTHWILLQHGLFQTYYYAHHQGKDRNVREQYKEHPWYQEAVDFCHKWDQVSFDPDYETLPLELFEPMVQRVFAREPLHTDWQFRWRC